MADFIKVLGQVEPGAVTPTLLYTTPSLTSTTTSSICVCNKSVRGKFRISVRKAGEGADDKQYIFFDADLAEGATVISVIGMTLADGDTVYVYANTAEFSFNLFGVETK